MGETQSALTLQPLPYRLAVCKLTSLAKVDFSAPFWALSQTGEELSLVCPAEYVPSDCAAVQYDFCAVRVCGILDFALVGILAGLTAALAADGISVLALSTYDTDYLMVRGSSYPAAVSALEAAGYVFT